MRTAILVLLFAFSLSAAEPITADGLVLRLLDSEALYTVRGPIKPISEGFWSQRFDAAQTSTAEIDAVRRHLASVFPQELFASGVVIFANVHDGKKYATAFIAHRPLVRGIVLKYPQIFGPLGISWLSEPQAILEAVDRAESSTRWRAFGLLFGYPEEAVDFFVKAGESQKATGKFVERDFRNVPTYASEKGRFVYAVPKGSAENWLDRDIRRRAEPILEDYKQRRSFFVPDGKTGAVCLLQSWFASESTVSKSRQSNSHTRRFQLRFSKYSP
jgi:hypothetical protein